MTSLNVIENKMALIQKYLKILEGYKSKSKAEIENDVTLKGAVERYLYLVSQASLDLAEAVIAFKKFRKPPFYSASFEVLEEEKMIDSLLAKKLTRMAGFRNILAHDYAALDFDIVYTILQKGLRDINEFVKQVEKEF